MLQTETVYQGNGDVVKCAEKGALDGLKLISEQGALYGVTRVMGQKQAFILAKCLEAENCQDVRVIHNNGWQVTFLARESDISRALFPFRLSRKRRAVAMHSKGYSLEVTYRVVKPNGGIEIVTPTSCSCTDYHLRCAALGEKCKHMLFREIEEAR